jgi:hypothetical protein
MLELQVIAVNISLLLITKTNFKIKELKTYQRPPFPSFSSQYLLLPSKRQAPDIPMAYDFVV